MIELTIWFAHSLLDNGVITIEKGISTCTHVYSLTRDILNSKKSKKNDVADNMNPGNGFPNCKVIV